MHPKTIRRVESMIYDIIEAEGPLLAREIIDRFTLYRAFLTSRRIGCRCARMFLRGELAREWDLRAKRWRWKTA